MSAASAVRVESPVFFEAPSVAPSPEETICELVHELRQPLSSIEAIAYYLEMTLPPDQQEARAHMHRLQELVDQAESILNRTGRTIRKPAARMERRPGA